MPTASFPSWQEWFSLHELYVRYFASLDERSGDRRWVECFSEDGVLETPSQGILGSGRAALAEWIKTYHQSWQPDEQRRHVFSNLELDVNGASANGSCYLTAYHCRSGRASLGVIGRYQDRLAKTNGVWRFSHRLVTVDGQG